MHETIRTLDGLDWDDVRLFLALCRSRTIGDAAGLLGVDASTVSRRLASLEASLGSNLFDRGRAGVVATEAAENLLPVAEQIEAGIARFAGAAETLEREVAGVVRIACPPDAADVLVVPFLSELLERHPALRIELATGEAVVDLSRREADLALRTQRPTHGDLIVTKLLTVPWIVAASPTLAHELGTLRSWADAPWVGCGERLAEAAPGRWHAAHASGAEPALRSDSIRAQITMVATGGGIAVLPERSVSHYGLVPVKLGKPLRDAAAALPEDDLFLVTHRALRDVPRVRAVWDFLLERAGEERPGARGSRSGRARRI